jgi:myo-inositol catabolism protein IolC
LSTDPWFIFAFDHRNSFRGILRAAVGDESRARAIGAKSILFDGFRQALLASEPLPGAAILIDEEYGSGFAQPARTLGAQVVVAAERSGQEEFQLEYGTDYLAHLHALRPDGVKVLLRWDPDGDAALNGRQGALLAEVSAALAPLGIPLIVEFLTPALPPAERAETMVRAIEQILAAGAEPTLWKVEGLETTEGCRAIAEAISANGRSARVIVLGRGVTLETAVGWLEAAAPVERFNGFAIGKTVWQEPLEAALRGEKTRAEAVDEIARRYLRLVDAWTAARTASAIANS